MTRGIRRRRLGRTGRAVLNWGAQLIIAIGGVIALDDENYEFILVWCLLGTLYAFIVVLSLAVYARTDPHAPSATEELPRWLGRLRGIITLFVTVVPATIGVSSALMVIVFRQDAEIGQYVKFTGVWAMLLAWGFLHWGFAQIYAHRVARAQPNAVLRFPGDGAEPTLLDFVYFSFALGTTFAASDVEVLTPRMRWLVTVQSVLGFFMNSLIIVLAFNVITDTG